MKNANNIVFVGAGNLATHLATALKNAGYPIVQVFSRTTTSAKQLSDVLDCNYTIDIDSITEDADYYFFALSDAALPSVCKKIAERKSFANKTFVHTAGSLPLSVFNGMVEQYGVLYPLQTFSKQKAVDFSSIPICVEANSTAVENKLMIMAKQLSQNTQLISSEKRKHLHLAAVFACNFVNHLYALSYNITEANEIPFDILRPLIKETCDKVMHNIPKEVQTGPAVRFDNNIINNQLDLLKQNKNLQDIYLQLSKSIFAAHNEKK